MNHYLIYTSNKGMNQDNLFLMFMSLKIIKIIHAIILIWVLEIKLTSIDFTVKFPRKNRLSILL